MKRMSFIFIYIIPFLFINCNKNISPISSEWTKGKIQLTSSGFDDHPFISPDGKHVAFKSVRNTYNPDVATIISELWIISDYEKNERILISQYDKDISSQGKVDVFDIDWFPDSKSMIAEIRVEGLGYYKSEIWRIYLDGKKERITSPQNSFFYTTCSPNGEQIAFVINDPNNTPQSTPIFHIMVLNQNGSNETIIESGSCVDYTWSYDSKGIIYSKYDRDNNNFDLWYSSVNGSEKYQITNTKFDEVNPSCSSDGKYLAFTVEDSLMVSEINTFKPIKIIQNLYKPQWINNGNLLLVIHEGSEYSEETGYFNFWAESWIIDLSGNIIRKIEEGNFTGVSFSKAGMYYSYSLDGNIWLDQLINN